MKPIKSLGSEILAIKYCTHLIMISMIGGVVYSFTGHDVWWGIFHPSPVAWAVRILFAYFLATKYEIFKKKS